MKRVARQQSHLSPECTKDLQPCCADIDGHDRHGQDGVTAVDCGEDPDLIVLELPLEEGDIAVPPWFVTALEHGADRSKLVGLVFELLGDDSETGGSVQIGSKRLSMTAGQILVRVGGHRKRNASSAMRERRIEVFRQMERDAIYLL